MRVTTFRGETAVAAIADRAYAGLSAAAREKAVAALLKENPQLALLDKVKPGTVLRIPDVPGLRPARGRGLEGPADEIADFFARRLEAYGKEQARRHDEFQADLRIQAGLLKEVRRGLETSHDAAELAARAADAIKTQGKETGETSKLLQAAVAGLVKDLCP